MTIWDNIYKNYQKGGEAWASLADGIHPLFNQFLKNNNFEKKYIFDIGCGTGKYLKYLQALGFKTDGIDSSETSIEMSKKALSDDSQLQCANMFEYDIPKNKYDLVVSVSTIHHGTKEQVQKLVNQIYDAIIDNGNIFITVPDLESTKKWNTFKDHEEIADSTFAPLSGPEKGLPHSFYTKNEVENLFSKFKNVKIDLDDIGRWVVQANKI